MKSPATLMFLTLLALLCSCKGERASLPESKPLLVSPDALTLEAGMSAELTVSGADDYNVTVSTPIVVFTVEGDRIVVRAMEEGSALLTVRTADRRQAACRIAVSPRVTIEPLTPGQISDATPRFESASLLMRYGTPGVMYLVRDGGAEFSLIDLADAGNTVSFRPDERKLYIGGTEIGIAGVKSTETPGCEYHQMIVRQTGEVVLFVSQR